MNPLSRLLLVVATFGLLTVSSPALAAEDAPLLWTGTIQSVSGGGAPADVTAYLQPTADMTWGDQAVELTPIASTTADANGRFLLRARYDDRFRAAEDRVDCGGRTAYELKPTMWTGGMRTAPTSTMACTTRFKIPVIERSSLTHIEVAYEANGNRGRGPSSRQRRLRRIPNTPRTTVFTIVRPSRDFR